MTNSTKLAKTPSITKPRRTAQCFLIRLLASEDGPSSRGPPGQRLGTSLVCGRSRRSARSSFALCRPEIFTVPEHGKGFFQLPAIVMMSQVLGVVITFGETPVKPLSHPGCGMGSSFQPWRQGSRAVSVLQPRGLGDGARGPVQVHLQAMTGARCSVRGHSVPGSQPAPAQVGVTSRLTRVAAKHRDIAHDPRSLFSVCWAPRVLEAL